MTQYPATTPFERNPGVETQVSYTAQGHTQKESNVLESKEYEYNAAERLIRYASTEQGQSGPQIEASYRHDPFGRRIAKTVKQGSQTKTTYYIYSEQGLMAEADEKGQMTKAYRFNPTTMQLGLWSTDPVWQAETPNGSLTDPKARYDWLHTDHLGTPILATTKEGQTSWKAIAESFGSTQIIEQDIEVNLRFPGQYFDAETGTYYNFHRDYRPNAGRYLQSDPIGVEGGVNLFEYARVNGIRYADPYGEVAIPAPCLANPAACAALVVATVTVIWDGCKVVVKSIPQSIFSIGNNGDLTADQRREMAAERKAYKERCTEPNPKGMSPCDEAKWKLDRNKDCYNMRKSFMEKWFNDNEAGHVEELENLKKSIEALAEFINRECCDDCQK